MKAAAASGVVLAARPGGKTHPASTDAAAQGTPAPVQGFGLDADAIVVGSGFGGAVAACRLAEKGFRVIVLERGRRWQSKHFPRAGATTFPRKAGDPFLWSQDDPQEESGWFDVRLFPGMLVVQAAGVGGGSLAYSNVSTEPSREVFNAGWPKGLTYDELKPHYDEVGRMLAVAAVPEGQLTERFKLVREAAQAKGYEHLFRALPLAVSFERTFVPEPLPGGRPRTVESSTRFLNPEGVEQGTCVHLGTCNIGCDAMARNSLDVNYLAKAESAGAEIRPLHLVRRLSREAQGFRVDFDRILVDRHRLEKGTLKARVVVLAAGSLGTSELLLRCRDQHKTLTRLSPWLGAHWASNANFLTPAIHAGRRVSPTQGPTISAAIDFNEALYDGESIHIEDGGFPDVLGTWLRDNPARTFRDWLVNVVLGMMRDQLGAADKDADRTDPYRYLMPWFAQGRDYGEGRLRLRRKFLGILGPRQLRLDWSLAASKRTFDKIVELHSALAKATGGEPKISALWTDFQTLATPHPLGGCSMADPMGEGAPWTDQQGHVRRTDQGVVDQWGEVFGQPGLYVADGSLIPRSIGRNPSRTIAALAERISAHLVTALRA